MSNLKTMKIINISCLILAAGMSITFLKYIGATSSDEYFKSFSSYIKKEGINELYYDKNKQSLEIKKNNIKVIVRKNFEYINELYIKDDILFFSKTDSLISTTSNDFTFGSKLKAELAEIKVLFNKIEEVEINSEKQIQEYYSKFQPYNVSFCDFSYKISLFNKKESCPFENNVRLSLNTTDKTYELVIDNYPEWSLIFKNYINFSDKKVSEEIEQYKATSNSYTGKFYVEHTGIKNITDKDTILYEDGTVKKTKRDITSEVLVIKKDNKEYIEDLDSETTSYVKYKDIDTFNEDMKYITDNLIN